MSLQLVYGRAGTGKSTYCFEQLANCVEKGVGAMMIVPEQFSHMAETKLIEKIGYLSADIEVTSFKRLSYRILKNLGMQGTMADHVGKSMILAKVLAKKQKELLFFAGAGEKPGFVSTLLELITELKKSGVIPSVLVSQAEKIKDNPLFRQKLWELSIIYHGYDTYLSQHYIDPEENLSKIAECILSHQLLQGTHIFIDEFFRFTKQELDCINAMLQVGLEVTISFCTPTLSHEAGGIFSPVIKTAQRLRQIAYEAGVPVLPPIVLETPHRFSESPELLHIESQYFRYPCKTYEYSPKQVELFMSADAYREVVYLATKIKGMAKEKKLRYGEMAIIAGNLELYQDLIKTIFPLYEIPVFVDSKRDLLTHPIMLTLFSLFDILLKGFQTQDVITYMKTGYSGLTVEEADKLENYSLAGHIKGKDWLSEERFLKRADSVFAEEEKLSLEDGKIRQLLSAKEQLLQPILDLQVKLKNSLRIRERANALYEFIEQLKLKEQIQKQTDEFLAKGKQQLAEEYAQVYNLLIGTLDQLVLCLGEENAGLKRLASILESGFAQCEISIIPPAYDQVFLGDVKRSLAKNVKVLFLVGANDKSFPSVPPAEGMLTDSERIYLNEQGLELAPDTKSMAFDGQFLIYSVINISTNSFFVSYPIADLEGKGLRPSPLVGRLKKLFPKLETKSNIQDERPNPKQTVASVPSAYQYVLTNLSQIERDEQVKMLHHWLCKDPNIAKKLQWVQEYGKDRNIAQRLTKENVQGLYSGHLQGSVSRFEKFAACPFSYFVQYGLKAKERKVLQIDTPDIGWLLHHIIDTFCKEIFSRGMRFYDLEDSYAEEVVDQIMEQMQGQMFIKNLYSQKKLELLMGRLKRMVMKSIWAICEHIRRGEFEPLAFEFSFDRDGNIPPMEIHLPTGEKISLIGRIDRIDAYRKEGKLYIKIIDYKSGNKNFNLSDIYHRLSLQLAVYITAVWENGKEVLGGEVVPAGMFYFMLRDPIVEGSGQATDEQLLKKFKMSGMVLEDINIIRAMDKDMSGYSSVIPVRLNKEGDIIRSNTKSATLAQLDKLKEYIKKAAREIGEEIIRGNVDIRPYREQDNTPCRYCPFQSICAFDEENNEYRLVHSLKDDDVWGKL